MIELHKASQPASQPLITRGRLTQARQAAWTVGSRDASCLSATVWAETEPLVLLLALVVGDLPASPGTWDAGSATAVLWELGEEPEPDDDGGICIGIGIGIGMAIPMGVCGMKPWMPYGGAAGSEPGAGPGPGPEPGPIIGIGGPCAGAAGWKS